MLNISKNSKIQKISLYFRRSIRLGQDSVHDFKIVKMEIHSDANWAELQDFIAILFLEKDVDFSGKFNMTFIHFVFKLQILLSISIV